MNNNYKNILELGLLFVESAIASLTQEEETGLELHSGVLHLFTGVELVVKARLVKEHWSLIFENVNAADQKKYIEGNYVSVQFTEGLERIQNMVGCEISERDRRAVTGLRNKRNRMVHSGLVDSEQGIKAATASSLVFLLHFITTNFQNDEEKELVSSYLEDFKVACRGFEEYLDKRFKSIKKNLEEIQKTKTVVRCCQCQRESAVIADWNIICLCCEYSNDDPYEFIKANSESPPDEFFSCWIEVNDGCCGDVVVSFQDHDNKGTPGEMMAYICFLCGKRGEYQDFYLTYDDRDFDDEPL